MAADRSRSIHVRELIADLGSLWVLAAYALVPSIAVGVGLWKVLDAGQREGLLGGLLTFLILEGLVLYEVLSRTSDEVRGLKVQSDALCRLFAGPPHARLVPDGVLWTSEGVIWLGIICEPSSLLKATLRVPAGLELTWVSRESFPAVWRLIGSDALGMSSWEITVTHANLLTPLGQFQLSAAATFEPEGRFLQLVVEGRSSSNRALGDEIAITLLQSSGHAVPMRLISSADLESRSAATVEPS